MPTKNRFILNLTVNVAVFFVVIIFHTSEIIDISIKNATPMLLLPLLTAFAFFSPMSACIIAGLISGTLLDSISQGYCFNTLVLLVLAISVNLIANTLFNKNLFSAVLLSFMTSGAYYLLRWCVFHLVNRTLEDSLGYLLLYGLPSAVYSAILIFPFYYLYKALTEPVILK